MRPSVIVMVMLALYAIPVDAEVFSGKKRGFAKNIPQLYNMLITGSST